MLEKTHLECPDTCGNITNRSGVQFYDSAMPRLVIQLQIVSEIQAIDDGHPNIGSALLGALCTCTWPDSDVRPGQVHVHSAPAFHFMFGCPSSIAWISETIWS